MKTSFDNNYFEVIDKKSSICILLLLPSDFLFGLRLSKIFIKNCFLQMWFQSIKNFVRKMKDDVYKFPEHFSREKAMEREQVNATENKEQTIGNGNGLAIEKKEREIGNVNGLEIDGTVRDGNFLEEV